MALGLTMYLPNHGGTRVRRCRLPRGTLFLLASLLAGGAPCWGGQLPPQVACGARGQCVVSRLPLVLTDREVLGYLKSGLTTTLGVSLSAKGDRGERLTASSSIDVRFEPWEEVFLVTTNRTGGRPELVRLSSERALHAWWVALRVSVALGGVPRKNVSVELSLIPFSEEEEADARRWYAQALRTERLRPRVDTTPELLGDMVDALSLTSIKRHGVLRFSWTVPVEGAP